MCTGSIELALKTKNSCYRLTNLMDGEKPKNSHGKSCKLSRPYLHGCGAHRPAAWPAEYGARRVSLTITVTDALARCAAVYCRRFVDGGALLHVLISGYPLGQT